MRLIRKYKRPVAFLLTLLLVVQPWSGTAVFAITGHKNMPEYRSFEPVATTNMVSVFDGRLTYNVNILEIPNGYPLNLSYSNGNVNPEALATNTGLGFTLNPGAINRMKRGFYDEAKNDPVTYHSKMPANWTISAGVGATPEAVGSEVEATAGITCRYNNYNGVGLSLTYGLDIGGVASLNLSNTNGKFGFNADINPQAIFAKLTQSQNDSDPKSEETDDQELEDKVEKKAEEYTDEEKQKANDDITKNVYETKLRKSSNQRPQIGIGVGIFSLSSAGANGSKFPGSIASLFNNTPLPTSVNQYRGIMVNFKADMGTDIFPFPVDAEGNVSGGYTRQESEPERTLNTYGYLNLEDGYRDEAGMMDYYTENEAMFEKRDNILPVPLPNNDVFTVTGEAMGGSFRAYRSEYGHYRKNQTYSDDISVSVGADVTMASVVGTTPFVSNTVYGIGGEVNANYHYSQVGNWKHGINTSTNKRLEDEVVGFNVFKGRDQFPVSDENYFFRFSGEMGGSFDMVGTGTLDDEAERAGLTCNGGVSLFGCNLSLNHLKSGSYVPDSRASRKRSSFIRHSFTEDFRMGTLGVTAGNDPNGVQYKVYENNLEIMDEGTASIAKYKHYDQSIYNENAIGEYTVHNADGVGYTYGLPVYSRDERELQYSLDEQFQRAADAANILPEDDYILEPSGLIATVLPTKGTNIDNLSKRKLGHEAPTPYPTTYLITKICSPDYIDRTNDGTTPDDFGSYTRFNYTRLAGGNGDWYGYRTPFKGLSFNRGSLSDRDDDVGSFSYGEKEVYLLHSVASKTHVAIFTYDDAGRKDGSAVKLGNDPAEGVAIEGEQSGATPANLRPLLKIELYSLNDCELETGSNQYYKAKTGALPIKTVHFEYDYSLCRNLPNNSNTGTNYDQSGKLVLKKLWFEYEGKLPSKISPYKFEYKYPTHFGDGVDYPEPYDHFQDYMATAKQNPDYDYNIADRWGNYRDFGALKADLGELAQFWPFVHQKDNPDFDPAAWMLKRIMLPSGGEIHIQYEQDDYQYVQDRRAMFMVPLDKDNTQHGEGVEAGVPYKKYYLDLSKVGIDVGSLTDAQRLTIARDLFAPMRDGYKDGKQQRMYFNFMYQLIGPLEENTNLDNKQFDFVEGFARIDGYGADADGVYFRFDYSGLLPQAGYEKIKYEGKTSKRELPQKVCREFVRTQRNGKLADPGSNLDERIGIMEGLEEGGTGEEMIRAFGDVVEELGNGVYGALTTKCLYMKPEMSYVRVQVPVNNIIQKKKKGGGVRVKRLLMYDNSFGAPELYGQEYDYTTTDDDGNIMSSGVAANEPGSGRRESPLVHPIDKDAPRWYEALLFGRDMYSREGPLGESLLPGASIGYSKVTISSIHKGETSTGREEHYFHTAKEFPLEVKPPTSIRQEAPRKFKVFTGTGDYTRQVPYLTQGYSFVNYSMHGQVNRIVKFAQGADEPMAEQRYEYFKPSDNISVMKEGNVIDNQVTTFEQFAKEAEVLSEIRKVEDVTIGGAVGVDVSIGVGVLPGIPPPPPVITVLPTLAKLGYTVTEQVVRSHVTTKIITYPAVVKRITNMADGVIQISENEVFDKNTGQPVVVRSYDDFKGTYLSQDFMAAWQYDNMRSKALNEYLDFIPGTDPDLNAITFGKDGTREFLEFTSTDQCGAVKSFSRGDLIEVYSDGLANSPPGNLFHVHEVDEASNRLYVLRSQLDNGVTMTTSIDRVKILRSGNTNELNTKAGNIMMHLTNDQLNPFSANTGFVSSQFTTDLNAQLDAVIGSNDEENGFLLAGPYSGMGIPSFADQIRAQCADADPLDITIKDISFTYRLKDGKISLWIRSFTAETPCGDKIIGCYTFYG